MRETSKAHFQFSQIIMRIAECCLEQKAAPFGLTSAFPDKCEAVLCFLQFTSDQVTMAFKR